MSYTRIINTQEELARSTNPYVQGLVENNYMTGAEQKVGQEPMHVLRKDLGRSLKVNGKKVVTSEGNLIIDVSNPNLNSAKRKALLDQENVPETDLINFLNDEFKVKIEGHSVADLLRKLYGQGPLYYLKGTFNIWADQFAVRDDDLDMNLYQDDQKQKVYLEVAVKSYTLLAQKISRDFDLENAFQVGGCKIKFELTTQGWEWVESEFKSKVLYELFMGVEPIVYPQEDKDWAGPQLHVLEEVSLKKGAIIRSDDTAEYLDDRVSIYDNYVYVECLRAAERLANNDKTLHPLAWFIEKDKAEVVKLTVSPDSMRSVEKVREVKQVTVYPEYWDANDKNSNLLRVVEPSLFEQAFHSTFDAEERDGSQRVDIAAVFGYKRSKRSDALAAFLGLPRKDESTAVYVLNCIGYGVGGFVLSPLKNIAKFVIECIPRLLELRLGIAVEKLSAIRILPFASRMNDWTPEFVINSKSLRILAQGARMLAVGVLRAMEGLAFVTRIITRRMTSPVSAFNEAREFGKRIHPIAGVVLPVLSALTSVAFAVMAFKYTVPLLITKAPAFLAKAVSAVSSAPGFSDAASFVTSKLSLGFATIASATIALEYTVGIGLKQGLKKVFSLFKLNKENVKPDKGASDIVKKSKAIPAPVARRSTEENLTPSPLLSYPPLLDEKQRSEDKDDGDQKTITPYVPPILKDKTGGNTRDITASIPNLEKNVSLSTVLVPPASTGSSVDSSLANSEQALFSSNENSPEISPRNGPEATGQSNSITKNSPLLLEDGEVLTFPVIHSP